MSQGNHPKAIVIGGSIGGLSVAHQLRAIGWRVEIYERTPGDLSDRGAGLSTHPALYDAMRRANIDFEVGEYTTPGHRVCISADDRTIYEHGAVDRRMTSWGRLYRPLRDNFPNDAYHTGVAVERVEMVGSRAVAHFEGGMRAEADLLVGADGIRSTVRECLMPGVKPQYAGYIAWRLLVPQARIPAPTWAYIRSQYVYAVPDGEFVISYPVPTPPQYRTLGETSFNIVWYRPVEGSELAGFLTDNSGRRHEFSVPPPLVRGDLIADMRAAARGRLPSVLAEVVEGCEHPFFQPIYDHRTPSLAFGRIVLLGDAAFTARPHPGAGVTKAALDAMGLADAINECPDLDNALQRYDRTRRHFGDWIVGRSADMGKPIRKRRPGESALSRSELDDYAVEIMKDYTVIASDVARMSEGTYRQTLVPAHAYDGAR